MGDLEKFMKNNQPDGRVSKLEPFKQEIIILKQSGYTENAILKFLAETKNVVVSQPALNKFIRKAFSTPEVSNKIQPQKMISGKENSTESSASIRPSGAFNWQDPVDPNQYL